MSLFGFMGKVDFFIISSLSSIHEYFLSNTRLGLVVTELEKAPVAMNSKAQKLGPRMFRWSWIAEKRKNFYETELS